MNFSTIMTTSYATGVAGATVGGVLGSLGGCLIGGPVNACGGMIYVGAIGTIAGGVVGLIAPSTILLISNVAQTILWSFSYLITGGTDAVISTVNSNPIVAGISVLALLALGFCCSSK